MPASASASFSPSPPVAPVKCSDLYESISMLYDSILREATAVMDVVAKVVGRLLGSLIQQEGHDPCPGNEGSVAPPCQSKF